MAVMEVVLRTEFQGQECVNRWNYVSSGTPAAVSLSFALVAAMGGVTIATGSLLNKIQQLMSTAVDFVDLEARDVYSDTDFYTRPFATSTNGTATGVATSPVLAYGYRTNRVRRDVRRGTKRFTGVVEEAMSAGGTLVAPYLDTAEEVRALMSSVLTYDDEGNTISFSPAVCGKKSRVLENGNTTYEYWPDAAQQVDHSAIGIVWEIYDQVRSQTSRQYGRGR